MKAHVVINFNVTSGAHLPLLIRLFRLEVHIRTLTVFKHIVSSGRSDKNI